MAELLAEGWRTLGSLLSVDEPPMLTAEVLDEDGALRPVRPDHPCLAEGPTLYLGISGHPEKVQLILFESGNGSQEVPEEDRGLQAGIGILDEEGRWGGPLKLTLAAALAIALARIQGTRIKDYKLNLSGKAMATPDELLGSLKVREASSGLRESAQQVYESLPMSGNDGQRRRILEIENEIDGFMVDLLMPVKMSGTVNPALFERLYALLDEAVHLLPADESKRKPLAAIAYLVHEALLKESKRARNSIPLVMEAERLKDRLKALWPSPPS